MKLYPSSSLYLLVTSPVVACFDEESEVLNFMEYKGSIAINTETGFRTKRKK